MQRFGHGPGGSIGTVPSHGTCRFLTEVELAAARLPARKSLDGYDWTAIRFPDGYGRDQLVSLQFLDHAGDLVFYGDVGTGKTHLACALVAAACQQGIPARFHTTASLVAQLRRAKDADRLDKELATIARYPLLAIDLCRLRDYADVAADTRQYRR